MGLLLVISKQRVRFVHCPRLCYTNDVPEEIQSGDDEGSFEVSVATVNNQNIVSFNVLLSGANNF